MRTLVASSAIVYGPSKLGAGCRIEAYAIVGRPTEQIVALNAVTEEETFDNYYSRISEGAVVGERSIVRSSSVIYQAVLIGDHAEVGHGAVIREGSKIGPYTRVWPHTSIRSEVTIGKGCRVAGIVGDRSVIADYVTCLGSLVHDFKAGVGGEVEGAPFLDVGAVISREAVVVGDVSIGAFAFVAAGAVVRRDVPARAIVAGDPARVVGERSDEEVSRVSERIDGGTYL